MAALWTKAFPKQARKLTRHSTLSRNKRLRRAKFSKAKALQLSYKKARKRINPISKQKRQALKEYKAEKQRWQSLPENSRCVVTNQPSGDVHHTRGKIGDLLCLSALWVTVIRPVHDWIADNPTLARKAGLLCPEGKWNTMPTEAELKEHNYRLQLTKRSIGGNVMAVYRPKLLATKVCEEIERDACEVFESQFWKQETILTYGRRI